MAEFDWNEEVAKNLDKMASAHNQSGEKSSKGLTEVARLITDADQRQATEDAKKEKREAEQKAREEKQQQALDKLTGFGKFSKQMQLTAAKKAKAMAGKVKDFAVEKVAGIKKAAGNLLDILMKGLGLLALWGLFKWIQTWDIESLIEGAKKVGEAILGISDFIFTLATRIGAWMGFEKIAKLFTGKEGPLTQKVTKWMTKLTGKGSFFAKIGDLFAKIGGLFGKIPGIGKILKFVKGALKFLGKIFVPVTVVMALWEAVTGFMKGFGETEGNFFQKMLGGIGGALKGLLDFFVFGIAEMVQDAIVWLLELFGFDGAATAVGDFNLVGMIKEKVFAVIDWLMLIFQDPLAALGQLWDTITGGYATIMDLVWSPIQKAIAWALRLFGFDEAAADVEGFSLKGFIDGIFKTIKDWFLGIFNWGMEAGMTEDGEWSIMTFINSVISTVKGWVTGLFSWASSEDENDSFIIKTVKNAITAAKEWLGKMFKFDSASDILASAFNVLTFFPNLIKDALLSVTEWLLDLFGFGEEAKAVANAKNFSIGDMIVTLLDKLVTWLSDLFDFDIKAIIADSLGALGDAGKKVLGWLGFGSDEEGKEAAMGGPIGKGVPVLVGEHGPELFVPSASGRILPKAQTETAMSGMGGGAPTIINAPTSNVSNGSSTVAMPSSSLNPMNDKYFRN